jgi:aquaporin TIP
LTQWVFRRVETKRFCWLVGGQFTGSFLAGLALRIMFSTAVLNEAQFGAPHLNVPAFGGVAGQPTPSILLSGIGIEFLLTFILTFVIYATLLDSRAPQLGILAAGLTLTGLTLMAYPLTGAAVNPARWFGPWLWELTLRPDAVVRDHVVYWVGPTFGALAAGLLYEYVFWTTEEPQRPSKDSGTGTEAAAPVTATLYRKK